MAKPIGKCGLCDGPAYDDYSNGCTPTSCCNDEDPAMLALARKDAEIAALKAECMQLRSCLSRIDYAFGEPNEMGCSPYDADFDGERVVRQVEAMAATVPEPPTEDAGS